MKDTSNGFTIYLDRDGHDELLVTIIPPSLRLHSVVQSVVGRDPRRFGGVNQGWISVENGKFIESSGDLQGLNLRDLVDAAADCHRMVKGAPRLSSFTSAELAAENERWRVESAEARQQARGCSETPECCGSGCSKQVGDMGVDVEGTPGGPLSSSNDQF